MNRTWQRPIALVVALSLLMGFLPAPSVAAAEQPQTLSMANGNIEVIVSTKNGGFLVRTRDGDILSKDDNNKNLLYHSDAFDTSFASFVVTESVGTREYIFGNNYSFLGWGNNLSVTKVDTGIKAVWTVNHLTFTQLLEPVANLSSQEHGTVRISYSVVNHRAEPISVKARLLLDTAIGNQDYAYYELAQPPSAGGGITRVETEQILSEKTDDYLPANFFAYNDYHNPTIAAYTIRDESPQAVRPYQMAFGHWNNLASTIFDFIPDSGLTFTNPYNKSYLTADSALALYYDLGTVAAGNASQLVSTYYGVDSNVRVKDTDRVGISITAPPALTLWYTRYIDPIMGDQGYFDVTTNITNLSRSNAKRLERIAIAVLVDDGMTPLDSDGSLPDPGPSNQYPYTMEIGNLDVGATQQLAWKISAEVLPQTSYRKVVFRAYDLSDSDDGQLLLDNLIGTATTYILCPGSDGDAMITFTSMGPNAIYSQGTRHLSLTGTGFNLLTATDQYQLRAYLKSDRSRYFVVPATNIIFPAEPGLMEIVLEEEMPTGAYELVFAWQTPPEGIDQNLTAPALSFLVTADPSYRNNTYSVVVVVKEGSGPSISYTIKTFADEAAFKSYSGDTLLVLRGEFAITAESDDEIQACSAVSASARDTISINGALDFEKGNVQVYRGLSGGKDAIMVEFDGDLYTANSRTAVWSGNASITPLIDGVDHGLIRYDERGERLFGQQPPNTISLVWPYGYNMLQTIGGLAVDLRYGQFGAMYTGNDYETLSGYVVSFGGKLDLSFLIPGGAKQAEQLERDEDSKNKRDTVTSSSEEDGKLRQDANYSPSDEAKSENEKNKVKPVGKVNVEDVLFGKGKGYLGFNSEVELMLPKYISALPAMGGKLDINTIGGYQVGVLGKVKTVKFELEFELKVKSAPGDGTPVPDKIYFFMAGFEPGVNIDGAGAVWLTGAGGGIDRLYDTIFSSGGIPPLTLLLSTSFDIIKVMSGRGDLALSLNGFQLKLSDVKLKNTKNVIIDSGQLAVEWNPDFYLHLAAMVNLHEVIGGKAYIVVDDDFFELFLRASVKVPKDVDIIGGMTVANVDLGGNNAKIWGTLSALGVRLGVTYYWGGSVSFGTGGNAQKPTYPELLGFRDLPVSVDPQTGETLYLRVGTNLSIEARSQVLNMLDSDGLVLMTADPTLKSEITKRNHRMNLGIDTEDDAALTMCFTGPARPRTIDQAKAAISISRPDASLYELTFYNDSNPTTANANLIVDDAANTSTISVTFTDHIVGDWQIATTQAADLVLYRVGNMPEVTSCTTVQNADTGNLDLTFTGSQLDETEISIYLTPEVGVAGSDDIGDVGALIGSLGGTDADGTPRPVPAAAGQTLSLAPPADLPSGTYYLRMIVSKEDQVNQTVIATADGGGPFSFHHLNVDQPAAPAELTLENIGNHFFELKVGTPPTGDFDGYALSVYESTPSGLIPTEYVGITFAKNGDGNLPPMLVGGTYYTTEGKIFGLTAGRSYLAEVAAYRVKDGGTPADPRDDIMVLSTEATSTTAVLRKATPPVISFVPQPGSYQTVSKTVATGENTEETLSLTTFTTNDVRLELRSNVPVSGYWNIDGVLAQDLLDPESTGLHQVTDQKVVSVNQWLCDGEHTISFIGTDVEGDSFTFSRVFAVDTMPPRLVLSSPTNGSFFSHHSSDHYQGLVTISGLGDADALYTMVVDGETVVDRQTLAAIGATPDHHGVFTHTLNVAMDRSNHRLLVIAEDAVGHRTTAEAVVRHPDLATIAASTRADLRVDLPTGDDQYVWTSGNIELHPTEETVVHARLMVGSHHTFSIEDENLVRWTAVAREGGATVEPDGTLTISPGSVGFLEGEFLVADGVSKKASVTFGAEVFSGRTYFLELAEVEGGTVVRDGDPYYVTVGSTITLNATPSPGYRFDGWTSSAGGRFADSAVAETTFTMPANNVIISARFVRIPVDPKPGDPGEEDPADPDPNTPQEPDPNTPDEPDPEVPGNQYVFVQGELATIPLPTSMATSPNRVVAYYLSGDREIIVPMSGVVGGRLVFLAPASTTYYLRADQTTFADTEGHWAEEPIDFTVARRLLGSNGDQRFDPDESMTRAMFATVLSRLDGADLSKYGSEQFTDVPVDSWYFYSVAWASEIGVTHGIGGGQFGPDLPITREEMAGMLSKYLTIKGYTLPVVNENPQPFADQDKISIWAVGVMEQMRRYGIIGGQPGNLADAQSPATRAQCAAIFQRLIMAMLAQAMAETELMSAALVPVNQAPTPVVMETVNSGSLRLMNAPDQWPVGDHPVRVAMIDSGVRTGVWGLDPSHVAPGFNYVFQNQVTHDRIGHGSQTSAIVLGASSANGDLFGIGRHAAIVPLVWITEYPSGVRADAGLPALCAAIKDAIDLYGCRVINISAGIHYDDPDLRAAIDYAEEKGAIVTAAVGNSNHFAPERIYYPAAYDTVIGVGSVDELLLVSEFSQRNHSVMVTAPGEKVYTLSSVPAEGFAQVSGTSYSAAYVSALASLLLSLYPDLSPAKFRQVLQESGRDLGDPGYDTAYGYGVLDIGRALLLTDEIMVNRQVAAD